MGATGEYVTRAGKKVHIHLVSNPSHLEAVDPVTVGRTRAKQDRTGEGGKEKYLPLLVHGDAAFAGQGIVAETLNYADLPGYTVGGTVHVIVEQSAGLHHRCQGRTFLPICGAAGTPASIPIFHVNGEDVDAVVARSAHGAGVSLQIRQRCSHRYDRLSPPRSQRSRRSDRDAAAALQSHQGASAALGNLRRRQIGVGERGRARATPSRAEFESAQKAAGRSRKKPTLRELPGYWDNYKGGRYKAEYEVETGVIQPRNCVS